MAFLEILVRKAGYVNDNSHVFSYVHILAVLSLNLTGSLCNLWGMLRLWGCRVRCLVPLDIAPFFWFHVLSIVLAEKMF